MGRARVSAVRTGYAARSTSVGDALGGPKRERDRIAQPIAIGDPFADPFDHADGIAIGIGDLVSDAAADLRVDAGSVTDLTRSAPSSRTI